MAKLLVVEDDEQLSAAIVATLGRSYELIIASTLAKAEHDIESHRFDLVLLDVHLPDGDGFQFCSKLRNIEATRDIPIIFLTDRCEVSDRIMGFTLGADDYLGKPFNGSELRARIDAKLKRLADIRKKESRLEVGDLILELTLRKVTVITGTEKNEIVLTPLEFKLLSCLAHMPNQVLSRDELIAKAWGKDLYVSHRGVDTHISHLRKKLQLSSCQIQAVHGEGYRLVVQHNSTGTSEEPVIS